MNKVISPYYQHLERGELWLQYCPQCRRYTFYPRAGCSTCLGTRLDWQKTSGLGIIYSYTIVHISALPEMSSEVPYIYALVTLQEDVRMATRIIDCPLDRVQVGMPVELAVRQQGGLPRPFFRPRPR